MSSTPTIQNSLVDDQSRRLARWQNITLVTLLVGYTGYYLCRSNFSVVAKPLGAEFHLDNTALGKIGSWGLLFYAIGKLFGGVTCDFIGGRTVFLIGMLGSVLCTLLFAFAPELFGAESAATAFLVIWSLNRFIQSAGWGALVKVASRWYPVWRHGRIMGVLCLSYLFGDAAMRYFLGSLLEHGLDWQQVFLVSATILALVLLASLFLLKPSPTAIELPEPAVNPDNVFGERGEQSRPDDVADLLAPLFATPTFWLVCVMSVGLTIIRETFLFWTPAYLVSAAGLTDGGAGKMSSWFPFVGGLSALIAGRLTDRWLVDSRGKVIAPALCLLVLALAALASLPERGTATAPLLCIACVAFLLIGPYTFLTGVMALDFGGKRGSSTAAGIVDFAGYLGATFSIYYVGKISDHYPWRLAFLALTAVAALTALAAIVYWLLDEWHRRSAGVRTRLLDQAALASGSRRELINT